MNAVIDIKTVSMLTGEDRYRVWEKVNCGKYLAQKQKGAKGGQGGESYRVAVSSLPVTAQLIYAQQAGAVDGPIRDECNLTAYGDRFGQDGLKELLGKQRAVQQGLTIRALNPEDVVTQLSDLAADHGTSLRTLYRWMDAFEEQGLKGLMRSMARKDKGKPLSICPAAYNYAYGLYMNDVKRTQATIYQKLCDRAAALGKDGCKDCGFNEGSTMHALLNQGGEVNEYPPCTDPEKRGMRVPACRQTLSRILNAIPDDEKGMARKGKKFWKDTFMQMGQRQKPTKANEVWFGDHHQFDAFVLDEHGTPVRPWLTAWYDGATGCMVGWLLSTNPNTQTIIEAFIKAVAPSVHNPFYGLPLWVYVDNGKDYRSKLFETGQVKEQDLGYLNSNIATNSVLQLFNIQVTHALPYQGWSKPVERFFGTLEDIWIRELPGWCGGSPSERPEDFSKRLRLQLEGGKLWTMDQLYEYLRDTVFPAYHNRPHEGYEGKAPLELYNTLPRARTDQPGWDMLNVLRDKKTVRLITQQGVRLKKALYWDDAMTGLAGREVTVFYSEGDTATVGIVMDGRFLCEAAPLEKLLMVGENPDVVAEHMAKQKRQMKDTRERIRRASRAVFADEVDQKRSRGNITAIEYEKAARARAKRREELDAAKAGMEAAEDDKVRAMFQERYEALKREAQ